MFSMLVTMATAHNAYLRPTVPVVSTLPILFSLFTMLMLRIAYTTYNVEPSQPNVPTRPPANDNESERGRADLSIWKPYLPLANSTPPLPPAHAGIFNEPLKKWQQNGPELTLTFLDISYDLIIKHCSQDEQIGIMMF